MAALVPVAREHLCVSPISDRQPPSASSDRTPAHSAAGRCVYSSAVYHCRTTANETPQTRSSGGEGGRRGGYLSRKTTVGREGRAVSASERDCRDQRKREHRANVDQIVSRSLEAGGGSARRLRVCQLCQASGMDPCLGLYYDLSRSACTTVSVSRSFVGNEMCLCLFGYMRTEPVFSSVPDMYDCFSETVCTLLT